MISTVLEGASILDGTGRPRFVTDIALVDQRIAIVGDCTGREALYRLDCRGAVAAPGFIDACSQTGARWLTLPRESSKTGQGVATEITAISTKSLQSDWEESLSFDGFLDLARRSRYGAKGSFLADGDVRRACEAGAAGIILDLNRISLADAVAAGRDAATAGAPRAVVTAGELEDAIALAERANVHVHLAHLHANVAHVERALERIDRARSQGASLSCDVYPYVAEWIELASLLPARVTPEALHDDALSAAAALEMQARLGDVWGDLMLASVGSEERMEWCGWRFDDIASQMRLSPARAVLSFVRSEGANARAFFFRLREDDIATALSAEFCAIGSDASAYALDERLFGLVHPRAYGTFARVVGRFVRQRRTLAIEESVRRMTSLPAKIFGLERRGEIAENYAADINVFVEGDFIDTATYAQPYALPVGLRHAFIDGRATIGGTA